jgi:hypothetical protein
VTSSTNTVVNNIARRAAADIDNEEFLYVRVHLESLEHAAILSYDKRKGRKDGYESGKKAKRAQQVLLGNVCSVSGASSCGGH